MEVEVSAEAKDKRINRLVAITVVVLSVFMGLGNIKDGNIVQAMAQAQANSLDRWNEYQATRTKLHIAEGARTTIARWPARSRRRRPPRRSRRSTPNIARYKREAPSSRSEARGFADQYDALNVHDDQFDAAEASLATAISIAAVAALTESWLAAGRRLGVRRLRPVHDALRFRRLAVPSGCAQHVAGVAGAPGRIRTCDLKIRSLVLYPAELRARAAAQLTAIDAQRNRAAMSSTG